jgi:peptidoglycan LD-endopeptidase CwlK
MNDKILALLPEMRIPMHELLRVGQQEGIEILCYCGMRTCVEQAMLFRQSRSRAEIDKKKQSLTDRGYPFLSEVLDFVGPQKGTLGKHVTKAGPGESWHQYGLAADCVPLIAGKAMWEVSHPHWRIYGEIAMHLGLTWAGSWTSFKEMPHVQKPITSNPLNTYKDPAGVRQILERAKSL